MDQFETAQQAEIRKLVPSITPEQALKLIEEILVTTADARRAPDVTSYGIDNSLPREVVDAKYDGWRETAEEVDSTILHALRRFTAENKRMES
ncbi:hypothetical protein ACWD4N_44890 [Streptomyces sp. NPDC002586]